jgi:hypothetical protein
MLTHTRGLAEALHTESLSQTQPEVFGDGVRFVRFDADLAILRIDETPLAVSADVYASLDDLDAAWERLAWIWAARVAEAIESKRA